MQHCQCPSLHRELGERGPALPCLIHPHCLWQIGVGEEWSARMGKGTGERLKILLLPFFQLLVWSPGFALFP